jgi:hypothetical protein
MVVEIDNVAARYATIWNCCEDAPIMRGSKGELAETEARAERTLAADART